jgi:hypothetical protein
MDWRVICAVAWPDIYHNGSKETRIFLPSPDHSNMPLRLFLLDLEGVRRLQKFSPARRVKNLVQLNRTFGRYLRRVEKLIFVKKYLGEKFFERQGKRALIANVLIESERLDDVSRVKRAPRFCHKGQPGVRSYICPSRVKRDLLEL